jgi:hypothetical protein
VRGCEQRRGFKAGLFWDLLRRDEKVLTRLADRLRAILNHPVAAAFSDPFCGPISPSTRWAMP